MVRFKEPARDDDDRKMEELLDKMHGLSVRKRAYVHLYAQCFRRFPEFAKELPKPEIVSTAPSATFAYQALTALLTPPRPTWPHTSDPTPASAPIADTVPYFRTQLRPDTCAFCVQPSHRIRKCPIAQEYIQTGRATTCGDRLHLPNGQPIPNDGSGHRLQASINLWLAAQTAPTPPQAPPPSREPPPHAALSFEAVGSRAGRVEEASEAYIVEVVEPVVSEESESNSKDDFEDVFEVFSTEKKKREYKASKLPELAPITTIPAVEPSGATRTAPASTLTSSSVMTVRLGLLFSFYSPSSPLSLRYYGHSSLAS